MDVLNQAVTILLGTDRHNQQFIFFEKNYLFFTSGDKGQELIDFLEHKKIPHRFLII